MKRKGSESERFWNHRIWSGIAYLPSTEGFLIPWWIRSRTLYKNYMPSICECGVYILCMWKCIVWCVHCSMWSPCNETQVWSKWTMTRWRPETSVNAKSRVVTCLDPTAFLVTLHALCWHVQYRPWQCEKLKPSQPVVLRKTKLLCCWEHKKWTLIVRREEQCPFSLMLVCPHY